MKVQIKGLKALQGDFAKYKKTTTDKLGDEIKKSAFQIDRDAKREVPVDFGRLKSSLRVRHNDLSSDVYTDVEYAPFVEFGTGNLVFTGSDFVFSTEIKDYAKQFQRGGNRNRIAKPFLFPAWEGERPKFIKRVRKLL